jgi:predicted RNA-binding Zn-ribbon protein involved in translation (DUF1610 family)
VNTATRQICGGCGSTVTGDAAGTSTDPSGKTSCCKEYPVEEETWQAFPELPKDERRCPECEEADLERQGCPNRYNTHYRCMSCGFEDLLQPDPEEKAYRWENSGKIAVQDPEGDNR